MFWGLVLIAVIWLVTRNSKKKSPKVGGRSAMKSMSIPTAPARKQSAPSQPGRWVEPHETVQIGKLSIPGGMIYVGCQLPKTSGYGTENCLVDPTLPVASADPDTAGQTMTYWPAYGNIQPNARLAYLQWLASGRSNPDVGIGYVFLFFYGLERRVFIDKSFKEYPQIAKEVSRLLAIYGSNGSFNGYARRLLAVLGASQSQGLTRPTIHAGLKDGFELPLDVRMYLGRKLAQLESFDESDALLWLLAMPDTYLRTPAARCFEELRTLWAIKFAGAWPQGMRVKPPKTTLKMAYRSASGTIQGKVEIDALPDIAALQAPLSRLRDLLAICTEELDPYSRALGRKPEARGTLEAAILLPKDLAKSEHASSANFARSALSALLGSETIVVSSLQQVSATIGVELAPGIQGLASILDALGTGFEPDKRFGGLATGQGEHIALFRNEADDQPDDLDAFKGRRTQIEVALLAAASDGFIDPSEIDAIKAEIGAMHDLTTGQRMRLHAYALALAKSPPKSQGVLNRASKLDEGRRKTIARIAIDAVLADGIVTADEVRFIERLYKTLSLPIDAAYSALHRGALVSDDPVTIANAAIIPGTAIPAPPAPKRAGVQIDHERLSRIREQTAAVSTLLSEIFVEDASHQPDVRISPERDGACRFRGLDEPYGELLAGLVDEGSWSWSEFETRAKALKLLPDGALETINEWAFDQFDEALLDHGDKIEPAQHLVPKLRDFESAA